MMNETHKAYEELANAIVMQAVDDYRKAMKKLKTHPLDHVARSAKTSALKFFRSEWFKQLTDIDGEYFIRKLDEEVM